MITGPYRLVGFSGCDDVVAKLRAAGQSAVGPYGFPGSNVMMYEGAAPQGPEGSQGLQGPEATSAEPRAGGADQAYSGTNNQEVGVDEPDLVKTDGRRIVTVANGVLHVVDASSRKETGALRLTGQPPYAGSQLLLAGDHVLIISDAGGGTPQPLARPFAPGGVMMTLVGLSPTPTVLGTYEIDGAYLDARQVGSTARVVVRSTPHAAFQYGQDLTDAQRIAANRKVIAKMTVDDWLPRFTSTAQGVVNKGHVPCGTVTHPKTYSGTNMISVLSFDLAGNQLGNGSPITVVADGSTVYASATSLYVASDQRWRSMSVGPIPIRPNAEAGTPEPVTPRKLSQPTTEIYRFDISRPGVPPFAGGGSVPGYLLNQYAMSEWNGDLRVATTQARASSVYVLSTSGGALRQVGHVGGLGHNQQIFAVRFTGAVGYVVTFRQVDPLYVLDLSDPHRPVESGALELAGYSAYLHPMDDKHLIGIGQDADAYGRTLGTQVSIFDVGDPSAPKRVAHDTIPNSGSQAEYDPHAFLFWPPTGLLVVPVQYRSVGYDGVTGEAVAFHATSTSVAKIGQVAQDGGADPTITRSLIVGATLWTLSGSGLMASDMTSLRVQAHLIW